MSLLLTRARLLDFRDGRTSRPVDDAGVFVEGRHITAVAAQFPPDTVAAAQARGRAQDLEAAVSGMLAELGG